jgi:hypothetical protein
MFWDRLIRRTYFTFGEVLPDGLTVAANILALAYQRRLLNLTGLDDLSILILVLTCPAGTVLRTRADDEFVRRQLGGLTGRRRLRLLLTAAPSRLTELVTLFVRGNPAQRGLAADLLTFALVPRLSLFLGRLHLTAPIDQRPRAVQGLAGSLGFFGRIPLGTVEFPCYLCRRVLAGLPPQPPPPAAWPPPPLPDWLATLPGEERRFLACSLRFLPVEERIGVYLSFYAELSVPLIHCVRSAQSHWTQVQTMNRLAESYETVLRNWRQVVGLNGD